MEVLQQKNKKPAYLLIYGSAPRGRFFYGIFYIVDGLVFALFRGLAGIALGQFFG
jgi:hypothetical protein